LRLVTGYAHSDQRQSAEIKKKIKVPSICEAVELYRIGWKDHVLRMRDIHSAETVW